MLKLRPNRIFRIVERIKHIKIQPRATEISFGLLGAAGRIVVLLILVVLCGSLKSIRIGIILRAPNLKRISPEAIENFNDHLTPLTRGIFIANFIAAFIATFDENCLKPNQGKGL